LRPAPIHRPHDTAGQRLTRPAFWLTNALFLSALSPVFLTARVRWRERPSFSDDRPALWFCWHRYGWVAYFVFGALPEGLRPTAVAHDGLLSRLNHIAGAWLGYPTLIFSRRAEAAPRHQIIDFVRREGGHLMLLPDSGGPYGVVKPGIVEIARELDARLQPFAIRTRGAIRVGRVQRHVCALPFAALDVVCGPPIDGRTATVAVCQRALENLEVLN